MIREPNVDPLYGLGEGAFVLFPGKRAPIDLGIRSLFCFSRPPFGARSVHNVDTNRSNELGATADLDHCTNLVVDVTSGHKRFDQTSLSGVTDV